MEGADELTAEGTVRIEIPYRVTHIPDSSWISSYSKTHLGRRFYFNMVTGESVWHLNEEELQRARLLTRSNSKSSLTKTDSPKLHAEKSPQANVNPQENNPRKVVIKRTINNNKFVSHQYRYPCYRTPPQTDQLPGMPTLLFYPQPPFQQISSQRLQPLPAIDNLLENIRIDASVQTKNKIMSDRFTKLKDSAHSYQEETDEATTYRVRSPVGDCIYTAQSIESAVRDTAQHYVKRQIIVKRRASYSSETARESPQSASDGDNMELGNRGSSNDVQNMTNIGGRIKKAHSVRDLRLKLNDRKERDMIQNVSSGHDKTVANIQNLNVAEKSSSLIQKSVQTSTVTVSGETTNTVTKRVIRLNRDLSSDGVAKTLNPTAPIVHKRPFGKWRRHVNTATDVSNKQQQQLVTTNKPHMSSTTMRQANNTVTDSVNRLDRQSIKYPNKPDAQVIIPANKPNAITVCRTTTSTNNLSNKVERSPKKQANILMANSANKSFIQPIKSPKPDTVRVIRPTLSAKNSDKSSTKSTSTDILLNDARDRMAKLSHDQMKERDAQSSQSASESVVSDGFVRRLNLSAASRFSTALPESPLAESDFISNSDAVSVLSENLSRFLTQTALMSNALSTSSAELVENKFEVTCPVMRENIELRCDEFLSSFFQIMEEVLSQILQHDTISSKVEISPPWTLHEATKCLISIYPEGSDIGQAVYKLSATLSSKIEDEYGGARSHITPSEYMDMFRYGVNLVHHLSKDQHLLSSCDEIPSAIQRLSELLEEIKKPRNSGLLNESFNDASEYGLSEYNQPDSVVPSAPTDCASRLQDQEPEKKQSPVKFHRSCNVDADFLNKLNMQKRENEKQISRRIAQERTPEMAEQASISPLKKTNNDSGKKKDAITEPTIKIKFRIDPEFEEKLKKNGHVPMFSVNDKNKPKAPQPSTSDNQLRQETPKSSEGNFIERPMVKLPFTKYSELEESLQANADWDSSFNTDEDDEKNADDYEEDNYYEDEESMNSHSHDKQQCDQTFAEDVIKIFIKEAHDSFLLLDVIGNQVTTTTINEISANTLTDSKRHELQKTVEDAQTRTEALLLNMNRVLGREINGPSWDSCGIKIRRGSSFYGTEEFSSFLDKIRGRAKQILENLSDTSNILSTCVTNRTNSFK